MMIEKILKLISKIRLRSIKKYNIERQIDETLYDEFSLLKKVLNNRQIEFQAVNNIYTAVAFDYNENKFLSVKNALEGRRFSKAEYQSTLTYNKDHVHFMIAQVDMKRYYGFAVLYYFEPLLLPKILWFNEIQISDNLFSDLKKFPVNPIDER